MKHRHQFLLLVGLLLALVLGNGLHAADVPATSQTYPTTQSTILPTTRPGGFMKFHEGYVQQIKQGNIDLLFTGDSITFQWRNVGKAQWDKYYGSIKTANFGHSGDQTQHLLWRLQNGECDGPAPKVVVLMIGTNNMGGKTHSVLEIAAGVAANVNELRKQWPTARILLMGVLPSGGSTPAKRSKLDAVNQILSKLDDGRHVFFMDIGPKFMDKDGLVPSTLILGVHPTAAGYEIWGTAIKEPVDHLLHDQAPDGTALPADAVQ